MFEVFKSFFRILRDPEGYRQQQEAEFEARRQEILDEASGVKIIPKSGEERRSFKTLVEALDFIATCLENDDIGLLGAEMTRTEYHLHHHPDRAYYLKHYFEVLRVHHLELDIRNLYQDRDFPASDDFFRIGGYSSSPLGHRYIEFVKVDDGWWIQNIGIMR